MPTIGTGSGTTGPPGSVPVVSYFTGPVGEPYPFAGLGWELLPVGLGSEATLERLVYASLFTDRRLDDDTPPRDGTDDRRGWWADALEGPSENFGSRLWHVLAGVPTGREIEDAIREALAWMVTEGLVSRVDVRASVVGRRADASVALVLATGERIPVTFPALWSAYG